jgi:serine/threonine protein kinase
MTVVCVRCGAALPANAANQLCSTCGIRAVLETVTHAPAENQRPAATMDGLPPLDNLRRALPNLEIIELVGRGGMGAVFRARQIALDRYVALKILPLAPGRETDFAERFTREARSLARLNHPNIVGIHDFGEADGIYYFVMEYVDGANLREAMRRGQLTPDAALQIVAQVCDALQFAHDRGIVHRDIKPENLLLSNDGRVKIADFGLAKLLTGDNDPARDRTLTATQQVMGTFHYMAPEQLEGAKHVDHRADIYSLGVTLYEMLTGELPLGRFALPSKKTMVDARYDDVILRSLEKSPDDRYQRASDFRGAVERLQRALPPRAEPPPLLEMVSDAIIASPTFPVPRERRSVTDVRRSPHWWLDRPAWARRILKAILDLAALALLICFVSYHSSHNNAANEFEIGFYDPWLRVMTGPAGSHFGINIVSWSAAAGIAGGLLVWLAIVLRRIERPVTLDSDWQDATELAVRRRSPWTRYFYWAGLPTLLCWAAGPLGLAFLSASLRHDGARVTWFAVFVLGFVLGVVLPVVFHFLWLLFGTLGPESPTAHARRAGNWMFGVGVVSAVYGGAVTATASVALFVADNNLTGMGAMLGLLWGLFVFAGLGVLAMRGGHFLARRKESLATRIAAVLFLLPLTPLWIVSLPVGILVFRTLGRADQQTVGEDSR